MEGESNGRARVSPLEIDPEQFRLLGHELIDRIAGLLESLPARPVTRGLCLPATCRRRSVP